MFKLSAVHARTVLVVDDEAVIRQLSRRILEQVGYLVIEASNGIEGIEILSHHSDCDLLIADLDMPELGGDEMVRRIRAGRPDLKVLYVTGHIDRLVDARSLWAGEAFLDKPFTPAGLGEAVSLLVDGSLQRAATPA